MSHVAPKIHVTGIKRKAEVEEEEPEDDVNSSDDENEEQEGEPKRFKSREEKKAEKAAAKAAKMAKLAHKDDRTVFVGNLPADCERKTLRKHFLPCGAIESVRLRGIIPAKAKLSKKAAAIKKSIHETCKSIFGYVVFWDPESVVKALELNTSKIGDHFISVQRVGKKTFSTDVTIFIGNLPLTTQENEVRSFFSDCGPIDGIRLIRDSKTGIGKGFGFVCFQNLDGVILALEKNGESFSGREIRVKKAGKELERRRMHDDGRKDNRKTDGKNARRRRKQKEQLENKNETSSHVDPDDVRSSEVRQKGGVKKKKMMRSGIPMHKNKKSDKNNKMTVRAKKTKKKALKHRHAAGQRKKIAHLLTA